MYEATFEAQKMRSATSSRRMLDSRLCSKRSCRPFPAQRDSRFFSRHHQSSIKAFPSDSSLTEGSGSFYDALRSIPTKQKIIFSACTAFVISNMDKVNVSIAIIPMAEASYTWCCTNAPGRSHCLITSCSHALISLPLALSSICSLDDYKHACTS